MLELDVSQAIKAFLVGLFKETEGVEEAEGWLCAEFGLKTLRLQPNMCCVISGRRYRWRCGECAHYGRGGKQKEEAFAIHAFWLCK